jgi:putative transposase
MLVRYIVDIYHNTPHEGLLGETPRNAWNRLTKLYGVIPPPDDHKRRSIFGIHLSRKIGARGVRVLGLFFQSEALQAQRRQHGNIAIPLRVDPLSLSRVSVFIDGLWEEAICTREGFADVSVESWIAASADLRRRHREAAELTATVVQQAIRDIGAMSEAAILRAGIGPTMLSSRQIERAEGLLGLGFNLPDDEPHADQISGDPDDIFSGAIPVTGPEQPAPDPIDKSVSAPPASKRRRAAKAKGSLPSSRQPPTSSVGSIKIGR